MGGKAAFDDLIKAGKAKFDGDREPFDQLRSILVRFAMDFDMMPGTKPATPALLPAKDPFEADEPASSAGGNG